MIGSGVAAGFALFTVSKVAEEFGRSGALPPMLAAWAPAAAGLLFALSLLLLITIFTQSVEAHTIDL